MLYPWDPGLLRADEVVCAFSDWMIQVDVGLDKICQVCSRLIWIFQVASIPTSLHRSWVITWSNTWTISIFAVSSDARWTPGTPISTSHSTGIRMIPYDILWYSMIIWINVDYPMIFYDLWYPMILGSILAKFYSHQPSYNRSTNHVRLQVTPFWLGDTVQRLMMLDVVSKT